MPLCVGAAALVSACVSVPDPHPLTGTEWRLAAIDTAGSTTALPPELQRRHTVRFGAEGVLTAQLDCNRGRGTWSAGQPGNGAGGIAIGPIASTRMLCPQPSFGDQLGMGLSEAQRFVIALGGRELAIEAGATRMTFTPTE
jgi:heat shock protein HslJ